MKNDVIITFSWEHSFDQQVSLTEAHSAETLQYRERDHQSNVSFAFHAEHQDHEYEHERRLPAHDHELRDDVREQYFQWGDACDRETAQYYDDYQG